MTHRATIGRDTSSGTDDWNRPIPPTFTTQAKAIACRVWSKTRRHVDDDGKEVLIEDVRGLFPKTADIQTGDRVTVNDRRGTLIFDSLAVLTVNSRGANLRHTEVMFERHK